MHTQILQLFVSLVVTTLKQGLSLVLGPVSLSHMFLNVVYLKEFYINVFFLTNLWNKQFNVYVSTHTSHFPSNKVYNRQTKTVCLLFTFTNLLHFQIVIVSNDKQF